MSNSIDIKYRADTSQSVVATDKLLARITKLEGQLSTAVGKSTKVGSALSKSYLDAEARVKHFEKALKAATSVTTKYRALEGLQEAVRAFKVAKADFEDSMKIGHNPGQAVDQVAQATSRLSAAQTNAWNAEQSQLRASASLRQDIISRMTAQVALEKQLTQDKAVASVKELATVQANAWNSEQSRLREAAALRQDIISRLTAQVAIEKQLAQQSAMQDHIAGSGIRFGPGSRHTDPPFNKPEDIRDEKNKLLRDDITARLSAEADERRRRGRELDQKYASRYINMEHDATSRRGKNVFDSETALTDRRSVLNERMQKASPDSLTYKNMLAELAQVEAALKRIANLKKDAVSPGKTMSAVELTSVKALRMQIKYLKSEMDKVAAGPQWDVLNQRLALAEAEMEDVTRQATEARKAVSAAATAPLGSWQRLGYELDVAKEELSRLTFGTREFLAQQARVAELQGQWDNVNAAVNRTNRTQGAMGGIIGSAIGQVQTLAATYIGLHQVMQQITEEWEKQRAFQLDANRKGLGIEGEMVRQAANIGAENLPAVKQWARENQVDLLATQQELVGLVGAAISSGEPDVNKAQKAVAAALRINVGDAQMANEMLQGGLTIGRINNSDDYEAAFGQLRSSSKVSQAVNEAEFIGNVTGKMAALTRGRKNMDGMTSERALEFITSASRIQVDRTGEASSTNMAAIFQRMDEFMPERKKKLKDKTESRVDQKTIDAFVAARSFDEKLALLQSNKDLGNQFIDKQRTGGPKELAFALIQNNKATKDIMKEAADAVLPFNQAGAVFGQEQAAVRAAVPNRIAARQREAGVEQARTGDRTQLMASARATWDSVWNASADGTAPANLAGIDKMERLSSFMDRSSWESQRQAGTLKDGGNEVTDMIKSLKDIRDRNQRVGNTEAVGSLDAQLKALKTIADKLDELNAQVAAGKNAPPPAPRAVAPVAKAPPVPRMPAMNLNAPGGDVFGWFKK